MGLFGQKKKRVLVSDGNYGDRRTLTVLLQEKGYDVLEAGDGGPAVNLAMEERPDLILLSNNSQLLSGETVASFPELRSAISGDLPVPATSIYSRSDGVVNWQTCCLRPSATAENIEIHLASHVGLGVNPAALWAVADRLAQAEGQFSQFNRKGPFAIAYAPPEHAQSARL